MTHEESKENVGAAAAVEPVVAKGDKAKDGKPKDKQAKAPSADDAPKEHVSVGAMRHDPILIRKLFESGEYPYAQRMRVKPYDEHMIALQQELLKAQRWIE